MKKLFFFLLLSGSFALNFASGLPRLNLTSIINDTPYDLVLVDRFNKIHIKLPARKMLETSYIIKNSKNVTINGSMKDCMAANAQFALTLSDSNHDIINSQDYYINICLTPGGVKDENNMTIGKTGSVISKFLMAGAHNGCNMSSKPLQNLAADQDEVKVSLKLSVNQNDLRNNKFNISIACDVITDKNIKKQTDTTFANNPTLDVAPSRDIASTGSNEYEKWQKIINKESKAFIDYRNHKKANGTSSEKAAIHLTDESLKGAGIVFSIGLCSYVVDNGLVLCDATKNMPNRRDIALGLCTSGCGALYGYFKYEEMKKTQELKKAEELKKSKELQDFFGLQVSTAIQAHELKKAEELEKNSTYHYFTNEKSTYHWVVNGFGLFSSPTK